MVIVGCSHPGVEKILEAAVKIEPRVYSVFGGFHLADRSPDVELTRIINFETFLVSVVMLQTNVPIL